MLRILIRNDAQTINTELIHNSIYLGRTARPGAAHIVIQDLYVSRQHLRITELPDGRARLTNLSQTKPVFLDGGQQIDIGAGADFDVPLTVAIGHTSVEVAGDGDERIDERSLMTIAPPRLAADAASLAGLKQGDESTLVNSFQWLETVIALQRAAVTAEEYYQSTASALVDLLGLDLGMVLLRNDDGWTVAAYRRADERTPIRYSRTLMTYVQSERRTFYQSLENIPAGDSLRNIDMAVASPVFGLNDEVVGALYGIRSTSSLARGSDIGQLEAQVVQLLAAALSAYLTRAAAQRTRVQFEQFFSPELVRELERDPNLLEGRSQEVTVLVSDLRGFTSLSERVGPQVTFRLIRDMMEHLSEPIVCYGGVIVDYAGDGVLAMWNAPVAQPDHAVRACRAALAMQREMPALDARWRETTGEPLRIGIGVNTGRALVGNTGSSRKFKYGPHGYTVNLASRVSNATKIVGEPILITGTTRELLPPTFVTAPVDAVKMPGVTDEVPLFVLHSEFSATMEIDRHREEPT